MEQEIKLDAQLREQLEQAAREQRRNPARLLQEIVREYLEIYEDFTMRSTILSLNGEARKLTGKLNFARRPAGFIRSAPFGGRAKSKRCRKQVTPLIIPPAKSPAAF